MMNSPLVFLAAFLALSFCMMTGTGAAAGLEYYGIETIVERNLLANTEVTLIVDSPIDRLDYSLDFNIMNSSVETPSATSRCNFENTGKTSKITCDFYGMREGENTIKLSFYSRDCVRKLGDNYELRTSFPVTMAVKRMFTLVRLPTKAILSEEIVNQSYFPPDGKVLTDGKRIIVSWEKKDIAAGGTLNFSVLFEVTNDGNFMWDMTVISMTSIVVIIMVLVGIYLRRGSAPAKTEVKILPLLNKDEKKLVDILARNDGAARQSLLVKESDYSKAKVSRLVKNLKERGVVDTEPISGRENKVILKIKGVE